MSRPAPASSPSMQTPSPRAHVKRSFSTAALFIAAFFIAALLPSAPRLGAQQPRAELILVNGRVLTVDASDRVAQAVAVAGGRIVAVGSTADVERVAAPNARR